MIAKRPGLYSPPEDDDVDAPDVGPTPPRPSAHKKATMGKGWFSLFVFVCLLVSRSGAVALEVEATSGLSAGQRRLDAHDEFSHFWDFRGCSGDHVLDSIEGSALKATYEGGATCGPGGINLDGNDDYVNIDDWEWGGTTSIEVYVKYDSFNSYSMVFNFGNGAASDNVMLYNDEPTSEIIWSINKGDPYESLEAGDFDSSAWTHVVVTASGTNMTIYKNGVFVDTKTDGWEPNVLSRSYHTIGAANWDGMGYYMDGTVAYLKMWHGVELQQSDVTELYSPYTFTHFWDFRGCSGTYVLDNAKDSTLKATYQGGTSCGPAGISLDGIDGYVDIDDWDWGGTTSIEVYVKYATFNDWSRVFDFGNGEESDNVFLLSRQDSSSIQWSVHHGETEKKVVTSNFDPSTWTHVVVTVSGTTMKVYKNGVLAGFEINAWEPSVLTRTNHIIGAANWGGMDNYMKGTIAYLKMWHGVELQQFDVTELYAPHNTAHHFWDFRGCTTGSTVTDSIAGDLVATPKNGPTCRSDGITLGGDHYVDIDDWEWGGTTSIEVYVKYDSFSSWSRVFDFGNGAESDNVYLSNDRTTSTIAWSVRQGSSNKALWTSNFDSFTWTHVVVTVSGTTMKVYKNGALTDTKTDGHEPNVLTRTNHFIGADDWNGIGSFMDGTIAYLKMWHGVELQQSDVTELYAPHNLAHHFWDFRGCNTGGIVTDSIAGDLVATPMEGAICGADGISFDGNGDYVDIDDWEWGGGTSIEVYVKYDSFNIWSRVFDFGNGAESDNVFLRNDQGTSAIRWGIRQVESYKHIEASNWDSSTWTHVVATVSGTTMKFYKNGVLVGTNTEGHEPTVLTRTQHWLGRHVWTSDGDFDGTIAYIKVWHGVELQQSDVAERYAPHNTAHHFWDFRGCTNGATITDSIAGDLVATPMNDPTCGSDGLRLDGNNDYVDIDDWEWGGAMSIEVYVKYDSFNYFSMVFNFGNGYGSDNVYLRNYKNKSTIHWSVRQGSTYKGLYTSNWDSSTWTHVVVTVSGTTMKVYKNGDLVGTVTDGHEPNILTRTNHIIGNRAENDRAFDGAIAYMKMWHGVELQQSDVTELYESRDTSPCPSITLSGSKCTTCGAGKYGTSFKNKPTCDLCPAGRYSPTPSATSLSTCLACGAGKASSSKGATSESTCTSCDAGKYTNINEASTLCVDCVAGKSSTIVGARNKTVCSVCAAGTYQDNAGSTNCIVCPAGKYNADSATSANAHNSQQSCSNCYPGTYLSDNRTDATKHDESADCQDCDPGKFTNDDRGENECHDCPAGKTSAVRASACGVCPSGYQCSEDGGSIPCAPGTFSHNDTAACSSCPPGYYCPGATDKQLCFEGTYQNTTSQKKCFACPGGKHQYSRGATVCNGCPPGHFCPERTVNPFECGSEALYCPANSSTVEVIQKGYYAIEDDGSTENTRKDQQECEPGYACVGGGEKECEGDEHSSEDRTSCEPCDKFKEFNNVTLQCECKETFITEEDGDSCTCPPGKTLVDGECADCEDGWFKTSTGIKSCTSCDAEVIEDAFKTYHNVNKSSSESCACGVGTFRDHRSNSADKRLWKCQDCEDPVIGLDAQNVECNKIGLTLETLPVNNGFWRSSADSNKIEECDMKEACSQRPGTNGTNCREGHEGPICSVCKDGFSKNSFKGICRPCDELKTLLFFYIGGPILLIVTLIGLYYFFRKKYSITGGRRDSVNAAIAGFNKASADKNHWLSHLRTRGKILFSFYQIVSSLPETLSIVFPKMYSNFINIVSVISKLSFFEMINLECFLQKTQILPESVYGYYGAFMATMFTPILISFALLGSTLYKRRKKNSLEAGRKLEANSFFLFFLLLYLVFTNTTQMAFSTLYCKKYGNDKTKYLVADRSIKCEGSEYKFFKGLAIFFIVLYPIGIPATYFHELWKHRKAIQDADKRETDPKIKHISFLWRDYRPEYWWFEVYECGRRLSLTGGLILIGSGSDSVEQLVYALLVSVIGLFVITHFKPYNESEENAIAVYTAWAIFLTFLAAIMITVDYDGTLLSTDRGKDTPFAIILIVIEISIFVMVVLGVLHKPIIMFLKKYDTKHIHEAPLNGMGPEVAYSVDLFVEYCKDLARSDAAKAGWLPVLKADGRKKIEQWSEETGATLEWRCSTGNGPIDQGRVRFVVDQGIDEVRVNVLSIKDTHKKSAGSFIYVIDKGEDWRQIYRAVRLPWPWRQRDFIYTEHARREEGEGDVFVCAQSSSELNETTEELSVKAGRLRAVIRLGMYMLHARDDGRTEITLIIDADLGGYFAIGFLQRRMLLSYMRGVVDLHRKLAERSKREGGAKSEPPPPLPFISSALRKVAKKGGAGREVATSPLFAGVYTGDSVNNGLNIEMGRMVKKEVKKTSATNDDNGAEGNNDIIVL